jgi:hypothetical protein
MRTNGAVLPPKIKLNRPLEPLRLIQDRTIPLLILRRAKQILRQKALEQIYKQKLIRINGQLSENNGKPKIVITYPAQSFW